MNTARKGNRAEGRTVKLLEAEGWTVGSRRHLPGPGDLLAVRAGRRPRLIEVKGRKNLWEGFRRADRQEMIDYAIPRGLRAEVAWWPPRARAPRWISSEDLPRSPRGD
jgi:hypothetical protein